MSTETPPATAPVVEPEDRTVALLSYLTIIGFIIGLVIHSSKKTKLGAFHLRQGLGLALTFMALRIVLGFVPYGLLPYEVSIAINELLWFIYVVLLILGLIAVSSNKQKALPVVGDLYQNWFGSTIE